MLYEVITDTIYRLENLFNESIEHCDTNSSLQYLLQLGNIYSHRALYANAYENYWNALLMAEQYHDSILLSQVYDGIGWLYSFYLRNDEALEFV